MSRLLARLLVRLLRTPEAQAELRQAVDAARAEQVFSTTLVSYDAASNHNDRAFRNTFLCPNSQT